MPGIFAILAARVAGAGSASRALAGASRRAATAAARLWQGSAPVLRAIVENWRTDPRLTALWLEQMQTFTDATIAQITADPRARQCLAGQDIPAVASALTWLGERLYYLAATSTPPFDNQDTLVSTLLSIWTSVLYRAPADPGCAS
jgi:TetR/AcrR family transcriptional regulator, ethionamide resistance regulator